MQHSRSLILREDTFFGVCEALGEDFGFNPLFLRIGLAVLLLWNPTVIIGTYVALGMVVLVSRLLFPRPRVRLATQKPDRGDRLDEVLAKAA